MFKALLIWAAAAVAVAHGWVELTTTFGLKNPQPRTAAEAQSAGWVKIEDPSNRFAGARYHPPMDVPDKVLIYDTVGQVAGLQSGAPEADFVSGDCTKNDFYVRDKINGIQFCLATYYFKNPWTISKVAAMDDEMEEEIHLQRGDSWEAEGSLIRVPQYYSELKDNPDKWVLHRYFSGMGQHATRPDAILEDCITATPFQALYAWNDDHECVNSGFVASHLSTTTGDGWEKPGSDVIDMIFVNPPQCVLDAGHAGNATTMHVFLGGSTTHCLTD